MSEGIFIFNNCLKNFSIDTIRNCTQERVKNTIGEMLITFSNLLLKTEIMSGILSMKIIKKYAADMTVELFSETGLYIDIRSG